MESLALLAHTVARRIKAGLRESLGSIASPRKSGDYLGGPQRYGFCWAGAVCFLVVGHQSHRSGPSLPREVDRRRRDERSALKSWGASIFVWVGGVCFFKELHLWGIG